MWTDILLSRTSSAFCVPVCEHFLTECMHFRVAFSCFHLDGCLRYVEGLCSQACKRKEFKFCKNKSQKCEALIIKFAFKDTDSSVILGAKI